MLISLRLMLTNTSFSFICPIIASCYNKSISDGSNANVFTNGTTATVFDTVISVVPPRGPETDNIYSQYFQSKTTSDFY